MQANPIPEFPLWRLAEIRELTARMRLVTARDLHIQMSREIEAHAVAYADAVRALKAQEKN